ncbi:alpha/beta hydrolase [Prosthecomicrobium hirschii]|uniref:alpha/beta hydrolase n=1 Tax=Prosthecodimorpha hirschii TaxID=665126 RepID=UPI002220FFD9|nr:alpha/beta hydrolase [Prosthecomicrobium hirschii]MCW1843076.1 alpha/beta hydrolase [Prosthecomicrobium hirschii]
MDHAQILALIAALSGTPQADPFAPLRATAARPEAVVSIEACPRPLPDQEIEGVSLICGRVKVPEERARSGGKVIPLAFAVLKATSRFPEPDPVVYLQGGPGGSALTQIPLIERLFRPWRDRRDIVMFDQRSAGISGLSASCADMLSSNAYEIVRPEAGTTLPALAKACVAELEKLGVPLPVYNTTQNALDVPLVVKALGYGDYNLYGISYGTKLALEVMRVAPQGLRSVIIDGVAPSWVNLYNALALKNDEAVQHLVDQCAADKACNDAYPDLGRIFNETLDKAAKGDIVFQGQKVPVEVVAAPIITRNGKYNSAPITRFIPAYIYELWRGKEMPTVELLTAAKFDTPRADDAAVLKAAGALDAGQQGLIQQILDNTAIAARAEKGSARAVAALRDANESTRAFGPLVHLFDQELSGALREVIRADRSKARSVLADYTAMQNARPGKAVLQGFVERHTDGAARARLSNLIAGMSEKELQGSFTVIRRDSLKTFTPFFYEFFLDVYACQEDIPFSSLEGYRAAAAGLRYPQIGPLSDPLAKGFFEACAQFKPQPRDNWHTPVQSAIPTLSFGSLFDIQTPASWAKAATERLSNAQVFMIPEAGHGALIYQPCVGEMGVAFVDNPKRKFDNSCAESIRVDWHIAPWVGRPKP